MTTTKMNTTFRTQFSYGRFAQIGISRIGRLVGLQQNRQPQPTVGMTPEFPFEVVGQAERIEQRGPVVDIQMIPGQPLQLIWRGERNEQIRRVVGGNHINIRIVVFSISRDLCPCLCGAIHA